MRLYIVKAMNQEHFERGGCRMHGKVRNLKTIFFLKIQKKTLLEGQATDEREPTNLILQ
jgi:hypothetical protein